MANISFEKDFKYLWILVFTYSLVLVTADLYDVNIINIFVLHAGSGILIFPITYLIINIITEVYGYKRARLTILCGFLLCLIVFILTNLILILPAPDSSNYNCQFDYLMISTSRVFAGTMVTMVIAEGLNAYMVAKLKIKFSGRYMGLRFLTSTFFGTGISMFLFCVIAFYGEIEGSYFLRFTITSWLFRLISEIILIFPAAKFCNKLKQVEKTDIYDNGTVFNLFNIESHYAASRNHYDNKK